MNDLPPSTSTSRLGEETSPHLFAWWKPAILVLLCLSVLIGWSQGHRRFVHPTTGIHSVSTKSHSAAEQRRLANRFAHDDEGLSDEEYRAAALAEEALLRRDREARKRIVYRNPVDPRQRWQRKVDSLRENLATFSEFPEGSVQWYLREELEQVLAEEPTR